MDYGHILRAVARQPWALLPDKMEQILALLAYRAVGQYFTPAEIEARIAATSAPMPAGSGTVAVIPIRGVLAHRVSAMGESSGGMSAERVTGMVQAAAADASISTIVLDVDSPGGTVNGITEAAEAVFQARQTKRVVAVANGYMASAAYWIASQATERVAVPSLLDRSIGSIGVMAVHNDLSKKLAQEGETVTLIRAGAHKNETNPFEPLSDEARAELQASVDSAYARFVVDVARGLKVTQTAVREGYGQGRALSAMDALEVGLIDRIAPMGTVLTELVNHPARGLRAGVDPRSRLLL